MRLLEGRIYKNSKTGRYHLYNKDSYYWTCGEYIELLDDDIWKIGRVEYDDRGYFFIRDQEKIYLEDLMLCRGKIY